MIDLNDNRLGLTRQFGATPIEYDNEDGKAAETVKSLTGGRGVDTAIEAVGIPATFLPCQDVIAPGGVIAKSVCMAPERVDLHLERLWSQNVAITTRLVDTVTTSMLLKTVLAKKIDPTRLTSHQVRLDPIPSKPTILSGAPPTRTW